MKKALLVLSVIGLGCISAKSQVSINFESNRQYVHIDTAQHPNVWQIGKPQKPSFFDSAYSVPDAILTDTINLYPVKNVSSFIVGMKTFLPTWPSLDFYYKYDLDSLHAGGYIEVSFDTGRTWANISTVGYNYQYNGGKIDNGTTPAFTGKSNGWQYFSQIVGKCNDMPPYYDTVLIRFTFQSDSIAIRKDGWMIDNITCTPQVCEAVQNYQASLGRVDVYPNPASTEVSLKYRLSSGISSGMLNLYTPLGQLIRSTEVSANSGTITEDVSALAGGIYYYSLIVEGASAVVNKLVIIR
ncbi:MAG TPA: T9SS type A sorting domain-containing protein [Bacteroidia bacterium]|nr:T9SS type A sorting domain-containing protein [Bacteroidia bacterium]